LPMAAIEPPRSAGTASPSRQTTSEEGPDREVALEGIGSMLGSRAATVSKSGSRVKHQAAQDRASVMA
jgi:hypothetical protein